MTTRASSGSGGAREAGRTGAWTLRLATGAYSETPNLATPDFSSSSFQPMNGWFHVFGLLHAR